MAAKFLTLAFMDYKNRYNKSYSSPAEHQLRWEIFMDNLEYINRRNSEQSDFVLDINEFADMTLDEFSTMYTSSSTFNSPSNYYFLETEGDNDTNNSAALPSIVDWSSCLGAVEDQGMCGSCWAFAALNALEGTYCAKTGNRNLPQLSEQNLLDCDKQSFGCSGGRPEYAYQWIKDNGGVCAAKDYPYTARQGMCKKGTCKPVLSVGKWSSIPRNEQGFRSAVTEGPVSIAIAASSRDFMFYKSGIFTGQCAPRLDHAVVLVGYNDAERSYRIKNSWGSTWGEKGYARMAPGVCQMFTDGVKVTYAPPPRYDETTTTTIVNN